MIQKPTEVHLNNRDHVDYPDSTGNSVEVETVPDLRNPIEIYLDKKQKNALGPYWKSTTSGRRLKSKR